MQIHIIEVKSTIKNVNAYNVSSFLTNILDNEPNRNSNRLKKRKELIQNHTKKDLEIGVN